MEWSNDSTLAARLFVGFNVGDQPRYALEDLTKTVLHVRGLQLRSKKLGATFLLQQGIYRHFEGPLTEDGAQVIIIDEDATSIRDFEAQMVELAEAVARDLEQAEVVVELQERGIVIGTLGVVA